MKYLFVIFLITTNLLFSQDVKNDSEIIWSKTYKLKWSDFQGEVQNTEDSAVTRSEVVANSIEINELPLIDVYVFFNKKESWVSFKDDTLLKHEQLHFDISELCTRKLRKKLLALYEQGITDLDTYQKAFMANFEASKQLQSQYDLETEHSIVELKQKEWSTKIATEMDVLKNYSRENYFSELKTLYDCPLSFCK